MVKLNKNGAVNYKVISGHVSYDEHFTSNEQWMCDICGKDLPLDHRELFRHLRDEHQIVVNDWR